jgi:hypothetical protein
MTTTQRDSISSPAEGLIIHNTTTHAINLYNGSSWGAVGGSTGANPSASVGLSAVNGSATTFMRSDGAPALSQSIAPTWTGQHIWSVSNAAAVAIGPNGNTNPVLRVVTNVASQADGISISGGAAGAGTTIAALSSGSNSSIIATPKGTGDFQLIGGSSKFVAPAVLNTGGLFFAGDLTTGYSWRTAGTLAMLSGASEKLRVSNTAIGLFNASLDVNNANSTQISTSFSTELLTLSTGSTSTVTSGNLAPANSVIDAILIRVNTAITTAANFSVKVTGGSNFVQIGTATSSLSTLTSGTTYVLVPSSLTDHYNASATTLTVTTNANPGAGALRIFVVYRSLTPPAS